MPLTNDSKYETATWAEQQLLQPYSSDIGRSGLVNQISRAFAAKRLRF